MEDALLLRLSTLVLRVVGTDEVWQLDGGRLPDPGLYRVGPIGEDDEGRAQATFLAKACLWSRPLRDFTIGGSDCELCCPEAATWIAYAAFLGGVRWLIVSDD